MALHKVIVFGSLQTTPDKANLLTPRAAREDTGEYVIKITNPSGTVEGKINVEVLGEQIIISFIVY